MVKMSPAPEHSAGITGGKTSADRRAPEQVWWAPATPSSLPPAGPGGGCRIERFGPCAAGTSTPASRRFGRRPEGAVVDPEESPARGWSSRPRDWFAAALSGWRLMWKAQPGLGVFFRLTMWRPNSRPGGPFSIGMLARTSWRAASPARLRVPSRVGLSSLRHHHFHCGQWGMDPSRPPPALRWRRVTDQSRRKDARERRPTVSHSSQRRARPKKPALIKPTENSEDRKGQSRTGATGNQREA